jgi:hypothetical protein
MEIIQTWDKTASVTRQTYEVYVTIKDLYWWGMYRYRVAVGTENLRVLWVMKQQISNLQEITSCMGQLQENQTLTKIYHSLFYKLKLS